MKKHLLFLCIILFYLFLHLDVVCQQDKKPFRYQDFNVVVDVKNLLYGHDYKFILANHGPVYDFEKKKEIRFEEDVLYFISYKYNRSSIDTMKFVRAPIDTIKVRLNYKQADSTFILTKGLFYINDSLSYQQDVFAPDINDGLVAEINFDLGFVNDKYIRYMSYANINEYTDKNYLALYKYLTKLIELNKR